MSPDELVNISNFSQINFVFFFFIVVYFLTTKSHSDTLIEKKNVKKCIRSIKLEW